MDSAPAEKKKKLKHSHTAGSFRKASEPSATAAPGAAGGKDIAADPNHPISKPVYVPFGKEILQGSQFVGDLPARGVRQSSRQQADVEDLKQKLDINIQVCLLILKVLKQ